MNKELTPEMKISLEDIERTKEVVIRHGEALKPNEPQRVNVLGTLSAPLAYYQQRSSLGLVDKGKCLVRYRKELQSKKGIIYDGNPFIEFQEDPKDQLSVTVGGVMVVSEELKSWQINGEPRSVKDLAAFLRLKRRFFKNPEDHTNLLSGLQDFKMNVNTDVANKDNRRGETNYAVAKQAKDHNLPPYFTVEMPVFLGTEAKSFRIDLEFDLRDAGMSIYLLSDELFELQENLVDEMFTSVLKGFDGCAVLEVV